MGGSILLRTASAHARSGARAQLESANALLPGLAMSGGLELVGEQRLAAIAAAEELGDAELTARIAGGFDVPGIWTRSDDPAQASALVGAALRLLPAATGRSRARLLATVAMESRGMADRRAEADEAERIARTLGDPQLLCFALGARWMQCFTTTGLAVEREAIGAELVAVARTAELPTSEIHGRLIRLQALCALDDVPAAAVEADAVDALAARHERPLASVFTAWFRRTFVDDSVVPPAADPMPGFAHGIDALAALTDGRAHRRTAPGRRPRPVRAVGASAPARPVRSGRRGVGGPRRGPGPPARPAAGGDVVPGRPRGRGGRSPPRGRRRARDALLPAAAERAARAAGSSTSGPVAALVGPAGGLSPTVSRAAVRLARRG